MTDESFLDFALARNALQFGEFKLKSGRVSPYFFNSGLLHTGETISQIGKFYAQAIAESGLEFDVLFGPAYKGIPLASAAAIQLHECLGIKTEVSFNRKEAKTYGDGGTIIGAPLNGRVLIIDDVISAGTTIREVMTFVHEANAEAVGVVVCFNRMEKGQSNRSAIQEIEDEYRLKVISLGDFSHLIQWVEDKDEYAQYLPALEMYREQYGC